MPIESVKVRAKIVIGNLVVETPLIQSFSVRKNRGQVSTFDASLKVSHDEISENIGGGNPVKIYAGRNSASKLIFTGICRQGKISPCFDDPKYVLLSISGADILSTLEGKKFTRRSRATKSAWVSIESVTRRGLKSDKFAFEKVPKISLDQGNLNKEDNVTRHSATDTAANINVSSPPNTSKTASATIYVEHLTNDDTESVA